MSYSLEFCKARASNSDLSAFSERDWEFAIELEDTEDRFNELLCGCYNYIINEKYKIHVIFDPNANFDYFTSASSIHDGTLLFTLENINEVIKKVCAGITYFSPAGEPQPEDEIYYTVGNIILLQEFGRFGDKPWLSERDTVLLPIKYSCG